MQPLWQHVAQLRQATTDNRQHVAPAMQRQQLHNVADTSRQYQLQSDNATMRQARYQQQIAQLPSRDQCDQKRNFSRINNNLRLLAYLPQSPVRPKSLVMRLNTKQALAFLGFTHRNTLYKRVKAGLIPQHKDRGRNYYLPQELEAYMGTLTDKPKQIEEATSIATKLDEADEILADSSLPEDLKTTVTKYLRHASMTLVIWLRRNDR